MGERGDKKWQQQEKKHLLEDLNLQSLVQEEDLQNQREDKIAKNYLLLFIIKLWCNP